MRGLSSRPCSIESKGRKTSLRAIARTVSPRELASGSNAFAIGDFDRPRLDGLATSLHASWARARRRRRGISTPGRQRCATPSLANCVLRGRERLLRDGVELSIGDRARVEQALRRLDLGRSTSATGRRAHGLVEPEVLTPGALAASCRRSA